MGRERERRARCMLSIGACCLKCSNSSVRTQPCYILPVVACCLKCSNSSSHTHAASQHACSIDSLPQLPISLSAFSTARHIRQYKLRRLSTLSDSRFVSFGMEALGKPWRPVRERERDKKK